MIDIGRFGGPMTMADPVPFGGLGPGATFDTEIVSMSLSGTVGGQSCSGLDWWVDVGQQYEVKYVIEGGGTDCDPSDNTDTSTGTVTESQ